MATKFYNNNWRMPRNANQSKASNFSMEFDGTNDYIDCGSASYLNGLSQFSLSCWFKLNTAADLKVIVSDWFYNTGVLGHFALQTESTSGSTFGLALYIKQTSDGGSNRVKTDAGLFNENTWYNVIFTFNSGTVVCYKNGTSVNLTTIGTIPSTLTSQDGNLNIGKFGGSVTRYWNGEIDEVAIFDYALTLSDVQDLYGAIPPATPTNGVGNPMDLTTAPIAYYKIGDLAAYNGTNYLVPNAISTNFSNYALDFNGVDNYINCGNNFNQTGTSAFSISTWVKYTAGGSICVLAKANSNLPGYSLFSITSKIYFYLSAGTTNYIEVKTSASVNDGNWHNILITYDGSGNASGTKIYLDGSLDTIVGTDNFSGSSSNTTNLQIGARGSTIDIPFLGKISNVAMWDTELSAANALTLYNSGKPSDLSSFSPAPVAWWQLGENSYYDGTDWTVLDEIGTNNGTSDAMNEDDLVNGVQTTANGISSGMGTTNIKGDAPYSTANAISYNMSVTARETSTP